MSAENIKQNILSLVKDYYKEQFKKKSYSLGDRIPFAGRVFDEQELVNLVDSSLEFWLTSGRYTDAFEKKLAQAISVKFASFVNSGSSANLAAFMALTSPKLGDRQIKKNDEVITVAAGFPTTVNPIIQYGAIPVFVDVSLPTYNIDINKMEAALSNKTKAVMIAHTLGNPFNLKFVSDFCKKHNLWLIEDNCDALGAKYKLNGEWKHTGSIGDLSTSSFYPAHHITTGEGGAVYTSNPKLKLLVESFRDWGRDCWCPPGKDNTCKKRFEQSFAQIPEGYDHKYVYSHFGYNLKSTDMQAAVGVAQIDKLESFVQARKKNWSLLRNGLSKYEDIFILPEAEQDSDPSWFGFVLTIREGNKVSRKSIVKFLEEKGIQTRMLFAGNMIRHPSFDEMRATKSGYRVVGGLENTDKIMSDTFWIGVYPGIQEEQINYMQEAFALWRKSV